MKSTLALTMFMCNIPKVNFIPNKNLLLASCGTNKRILYKITKFKWTFFYQFSFLMCFVKFYRAIAKHKLRSHLMKYQLLCTTISSKLFFVDIYKTLSFLLTFECINVFSFHRRTGNVTKNLYRDAEKKD